MLIHDDLVNIPSDDRSTTLLIEEDVPPLGNELRSAHGRQGTEFTIAGRVFRPLELKRGVRASVPQLSDPPQQHLVRIYAARLYRTVEAGETVLRFGKLFARCRDRHCPLLVGAPLQPIADVSRAL